MRRASGMMAKPLKFACVCVCVCVCVRVWCMCARARSDPIQTKVHIKTGLVEHWTYLRVMACAWSQILLLLFLLHECRSKQSCHNGTLRTLKSVERSQTIHRSLLHGLHCLHGFHGLHPLHGLHWCLLGGLHCLHAFHWHGCGKRRASSLG